MKTILFSKFRIVSIVSAMMLLVVSVCSFSSMPASSANDAREYTKFNAQTGAVIGTYSLTVVNGDQPEPRSVIGPDDRYIDWSKSGVVKIYMDNQYAGTGFVVGDHEIATAAHVLAGSSNGVSNGSRITKILLFNSDNTPAMTLNCPSTSSDPDEAGRTMEYHIPTPYFTTDVEDNYDFAIIKVPEDLSAFRCFDVGCANNSFVTSTSSIVSITGFPAKAGGATVNSDTKHAMYTGVGNIYPIPSNNIYNLNQNFIIGYKTDTYSGNSGSPIYITETVRGQTFYTVIGIHTTGTYYNNKPYNHGTRFDADILKFIKVNENF